MAGGVGGRPGGERPVESLIEACTSLILTMRHCAEQRRAGLMNGQEVDLCLNMALQELKQRGAGHPGLLSEIESSMALLKGALTA
jgi:hypothetical protein